MGQRLVVNIYPSDEEDAILSLYYHWGAYSSSSVYQVSKILDVLMNENECDLDDVNSIRKNILKLCELEGGGIYGGKDGEEWGRIKKLYPNITPKKDYIDRNDGLIAFTPEGIKALNEWSEGTVYIYIDEENVCNGVIWAVDEDWENEMLDEDDEPFKIEENEYVEVDFCPADCSWNDIFKLYDTIANNNILYVEYDGTFFDFRE